VPPGSGGAGVTSAGAAARVAQRSEELRGARATTDREKAVTGTRDRGTGDPGISQPESAKSDVHGPQPKPASSAAHMTEASGTQDEGITTVGGSRVGIHERDPTGAGVDPGNRAGIRGRRLRTDVPEAGAPLGFQTQIGPEGRTKVGAPGHLVPVTSRSPDVLLGATKRSFRKDTLAVIAADPEHPLRPLIDPATNAFRRPPYQHGQMGDWQQHPYDWQAGHMRSGKARGGDVIVLQTRYRNQSQRGLHEQPGTPGEVTHDEVFVVGGIAVDKMSAWDLWRRGFLNLPAGQTPKDLPTLKL
jgi:hypothetical protein